MVNNNRWRPLVALLGVLWSSAVATGVVAAGWHRPSDAIGGIALATAWLVARRRAPQQRARPGQPSRAACARALPFLAGALALLVVVTAVVLALTSSQARQPADVAWWAFPIGQITIDLTAIAAVGTYAWLLKALRFGDPGPRAATPPVAHGVIRRPDESCHRDDQTPDATDLTLHRPQPATLSTREAERSEGRHPSIETVRGQYAEAERPRGRSVAPARKEPGSPSPSAAPPNARPYAAGTAPPRPRSGGGADARSAATSLERTRQRVREAGLEPARSRAQEPKSCVSASSTTPAERGASLGERRPRAPVTRWRPTTSTSPAMSPRHPETINGTSPLPAPLVHRTPAHSPAARIAPALSDWNTPWARPRCSSATSDDTHALPTPSVNAGKSP